jgi:uncharacterized protein YPO0396
VSQQEAFGGAEFAQTQWRAESMQLVNWGGFDGANTIELSTETTLLTGASGTGKSTILDAYLALMMDSNTPFNGASNDAARGRARGATQRSLLTYLRGKLDDVRTDGETTELILRGDKTATWGAIAVTFVNDVGDRYTVGRLYHVPRSAVGDSDIAKRMWSIRGTIALKEFEPLAAEKFEKKALRSRYPEIQPHDTYEAFAAMLQTKLGIGTHGDPSSALRLLTRIQAGKPVAAVDDLYKQMVLETPSTFAAADSAIDHFADLETAYQEMVESAEQEAILAPIVGLWDDHQTAIGEIAQIDAYGVKQAGSPFRHWVDTYERSLIAGAIEENREERGAQEIAAREAKKDEDEYAALVSVYEGAIAAAGGLELTELDEAIAELEAVHRDAVNARNDFDDETAVLQQANSTSDEFAASKESAKTFVAVGYDEAEAALTAESGAIQKRIGLLEHEIDELTADRESLRGRTGQIPRHLHDQRVQAAHAAGLAPDDLPFVAELIDVPVEHAGWRTAVEVVFGPVARIMLVDENHRDRLSRAIDDLRWIRRIQFQGVDLEPFMVQNADPAMLSGKLVYKDSPFTAWVQGRLTADGTDALCVDSVGELNGRGQRVTRSGQVRHGRRGAHGGVGEPIIGFDNTARLDDIERRLGELAEQQRKAQDNVKEINRRRAHLTKLRDAHRFVLATDWAAIDHDTLQERIDRNVSRKAEILEANGELQQLEHDRADADTEREKAEKKRNRAKYTIEQLDDHYAELTARDHDLADHVAALEADGHVATEAQTFALTERFGAVADTTSYNSPQFASGLARLLEALDKDRAAAATRARSAAGNLEQIFERFHEKWPNPNRGTSIDSYLDYLEIREAITNSGLHERRETWIRKLAEWTGEDLVPLNGEFDNAIEDIEDRLAPVNKILETLEFGAHRDRLRIDLRKLTQDRQATFRRQLRELSSGATGELTLEQAETKFERLQAFMAAIQKSDEKSRQYHLDVRKHIELSASVVTTDGTVRAEYTSLGEKSGGETQELVAFIVGSALRFQLGDETKTRPRFAPVFLDEGFVKADSEFAGRGVRAWQGLGFQLIVAVPFDKVTALEPHVEQILAVTKNPTTGHARIDDITDQIASAGSS